MALWALEDQDHAPKRQKKTIPESEFVLRWAQLQFEVSEQSNDIQIYS